MSNNPNIYKAAWTMIEDLLELIPVPPDVNCSCHNHPPCNDCVDFSGTRETLSRAEYTITLLKAYNLIS